ADSFLAGTAPYHAKDPKSARRICSASSSPVSSSKSVSLRMGSHSDLELTAPAATPHAHRESQSSCHFRQGVKRAIRPECDHRIKREHSRRNHLLHNEMRHAVSNGSCPAKLTDGTKPGPNPPLDSKPR